MCNEKNNKIIIAELLLQECENEEKDALHAFEHGDINDCEYDFYEEK